MNDLNLGTEAGWWPPDDIAAREFMAYEAAFGLKTTLAQFDIVATSSRELISNDRSGSVVAEMMRFHMERREPASMIRLGDADGNVLFSYADRYPALDAYCLAKISRIYFGSPSIMMENRKFFSDIVINAVQNADVVGGPERATLERSFSTPLPKLDVRGMMGMRGVYTHFAQPAHTQDVVNARWTTTWFSRTLLPHLPNLLKDIEFLGLITCYPDMGERLQRAFGVKTLDTMLVPMQASIAKQNKDIGHFPEVYEKNMAKLQPPFRGALYLVAAGILSKPYCTRIKQLGGIAVDIGSTADIWMGNMSRPGMTREIVDKWKLPNC